MEDIMGVYSREGRWMVFYHEVETGKRRDKSFGRGEENHNRAVEFFESYQTLKSKGATEIHVESLPQVNTIQQNKIAEVTNCQGVSVNELAHKYLDHLRASGKTERHIKNLNNLLLNHFAPFFKNKPIEMMTYQDDILPFILKIKEPDPVTNKYRSQITVNRYCDYLAAVFNFGVSTGLTLKNPMTGRKKTKEQPFDVMLTIDDMKKIMEHADAHLKWAMEVCFNLGTRPGESELLSLRYDHIDFDKSTAKIYATKTKTFRTVPIHPEFLVKLKNAKELSKSGYIVEYNGKKIGSMKMSFKRACKRAGINYRVRMYDIRHLFATTLLSKGADLAAVSKLMGHSTVKMTADTYYHYLEGEKERAVSLLPQVFI
jgi:integrase